MGENINGSLFIFVSDLVCNIKEWMVSYVPLLVDQPKWFISDRSMAVGDVVLLLKSDKIFDLQYQYGIVVKTIESKDGVI